MSDRCGGSYKKQKNKNKNKKEQTTHRMWQKYEYMLQYHIMTTLLNIGTFGDIFSLMKRLHDTCATHVQQTHSDKIL